MPVLRHRPIQQQITTVTLITSGIVLLLACGALFALQAYTSKRNFEHQLSIVAEIVANSSAQEEVVDDATGAGRALSGLTAVPQILSAAIYTKDGKRLAQFGSDAKVPGRPAAAEPARIWMEGHRALATQPIMLDGQS